jgi:hypothetical protein
MMQFQNGIDITLKALLNAQQRMTMKTNHEASQPSTADDPPPLHPAVPAAPPPVEESEDGGVPIQNDGDEEMFFDVAPPAALPPPPLPAAAAAVPPPPLNAAREARISALATDAVSLLRATPEQPAIGSLPKTWLASFQEWQDNNLGNFLEVNQREWSHMVRSRYNKRRSIYQEMVRNAEGRSSVRAAAVWLDSVRVQLRNRAGKALSLTQHLDQTRRLNPNVSQRHVVSRCRQTRVAQREQLQRRSEAAREGRRLDRVNRSHFLVERTGPAEGQEGAAQGPQRPVVGPRAAIMLQAIHRQRREQEWRVAQGRRLAALPETADILNGVEIIRQFASERSEILGNDEEDDGLEN